VRASLGVVVGSAVLLASTAGRADERKACLDAADNAQTLRDQGKIVEAREDFVKCAREACPSVVSHQCATWLSDINRELATISVRVTDAAGKDLVDVGVWIDGVASPSAADGRALPINPGVHRFRFTHGTDTSEQEVVIHAGEKVRPIEARLGSPLLNKVEGAPATAGESKPGPGFRFPLFAGISLGVGAMAFVTMGVLVATTASDVDNLRASCAGHCNPSDVSSANTRIVLANVAMGVGIVGVAAAGTSLLVVNLGHKDEGPRPSLALTQPSLALQGGPGSLWIAGSF
jgi:hypothetical protein